MTDGVFTVAVRLATASDQFTDAAATVTFNEYVNLNALSPSVMGRLIGYSYNAGVTSDTHDVTVSLRRPGGTNADEFILLESRLAANSEAVNNFVTMCGGDGLVVPRQYGLFGTTQPPVVSVLTGQTYELYVVTANKNSAATFTAWYSIR